eukprot:scaffold14893_cov20-Tisochrysis_lutea.AAC.2
MGQKHRAAESIPVSETIEAHTAGPKLLPHFSHAPMRQPEKDEKPDCCELARQLKKTYRLEAARRRACSLAIKRSCKHYAQHS